MSVANTSDAIFTPSVGAGTGVLVWEVYHENMNISTSISSNRDDKIAPRRQLLQVPGDLLKGGW